jgi:NTP pyrophosphatase (non-canonical NTP hydrolase)
MDLKQLETDLKKFCEDRDWAQFHSKKNLAISVSVEASELLEEFLWKSDQEVEEFDEKKIAQIQDELADVINSCLLLATKFDINVLEACAKKLVKNCEKYPVSLVKGKNKKYTDY